MVKGLFDNMIDVKKLDQNKMTKSIENLSDKKSFNVLINEDDVCKVFRSSHQNTDFNPDTHLYNGIDKLLIDKMEQNGQVDTD